MQELEARLAAIQEIRKNKGKGVGRSTKCDDASEPEAGVLNDAAVPCLN